MRQLMCLVAAGLATLPLQAEGPGSVDPSFKVKVEGGRIESVAMDSSGGVLIGGSFTNVNGISRRLVAKIDKDGTVDSAFGELPDNWKTVRLIRLLSDDGILVAGWAGESNSVGARLDRNGVPTDVFTWGANLDGAVVVPEVIEPADGGFLVLGVLRSISEYKWGFFWVNAKGQVQRFVSFERLWPFFSLEMHRLPDGHMLVSSISTGPAGVLRFGSDGAIDPVFDVRPSITPEPQGGYVPDLIEIVDSELDGRSILIGGAFKSFGRISQASLARLDYDGALDQSFTPRFDGPIVSFAVTDERQIVASGHFALVNGLHRPRLVRLNSDGSVDANFRSNTPVVGSVLLQPSGEILVQSAFEVIRIRGGQGNGPPDVLEQPKPQLARAGQTVELHVGVLGTQPIRYQWEINGKPIPGATESELLIHVARETDSGRYRVKMTNADGMAASEEAIVVVDESRFPGAVHPGFRAEIAEVRDLALRKDGGVLVATEAPDRRSTIFELDPDGAILASHDLRESMIHGIASHAGNKILIWGDFDPSRADEPAIARLNSDGSRDDTFRPQAAENVSGGVIVQPDDSILVWPPFRRLRPNGELDSSFDPRDVVEVGSAPWGVKLQQGHGILVFGRFRWGQHPPNRLDRLTMHGSRDGSFRSSSGIPIGVQPDGRILVKTDTGHIVRLLQNGDPDESFVAVAPDGNLPRVIFQADGKMIFYDHWMQPFRVNTDGKWDFSFRFAKEDNELIAAAILVSGGDLLVGGRFDSINRIPVRNLARVYAGDETDSGVKLLAPVLRENEFSFLINTMPDAAYTVEDTSDFSRWNSAHTFVGDGMLKEILVPRSVEPRFYRIRRK